MYLNPGCCHPSHAVRTKCACGNVIALSGAFVRCGCGRGHRKNSDAGGSFARGAHMIDGRISTGQRAGGRSGCPGVDFKKPRRSAGGSER